MARDNAMDGPKRCGAWARQVERPCRNWAMSNGRCRFHGGRCMGPPRGSQNALKHGRYTAEEMRRRRKLRALLKQVRLELTTEI